VQPGSNSGKSHASVGRTREQLLGKEKESYIVAGEAKQSHLNAHLFNCQPSTVN
jgi:hypothetical protein